jgi:hypothetical protein
VTQPPSDHERPPWLRTDALCIKSGHDLLSVIMHKRHFVVVVIIDQSRKRSFMEYPEIFGLNLILMQCLWGFWMLTVTVSKI